MYPYNTRRDKEKYTGDNKPKYYCLHCGHKTYQPYWFSRRCPKCGAATKPAKW